MKRRLFRKTTDEQNGQRGVLSPQDLSRPGTKAAYWTVFAVLAIGTLATIFPLFWMFMGSLKDSSEIFLIPPALFPKNWQWTNYSNAWAQLSFLRYFTNTLVLAAGTWLAALSVPALAAYSLSKLKPAYGRVLMILFLSTLMVPAQAYLVPRFLVIKSVPLLHLRLIDTYWGLWLPAAVNAFNLFLLKNFFDTIPTDLLDAARIDGASEIRTFFQIMLPLSKPVFAVLSIFTFSGVWNDFFWPFIVIGDQSKQPIMVALYYFTSQSSIPWNTILAALFVASFPPIVMFLIFQKQILKGITLTGLKG